MLTCAVAQTHSFFSPLSKAAVQGNSIYRELCMKCAPIIKPWKARFKRWIGVDSADTTSSCLYKSTFCVKGGPEEWSLVLECCKGGNAAFGGEKHGVSSCVAYDLWVFLNFFGSQIPYMQNADWKECEGVLVLSITGGHQHASLLGWGSQG